MRKTTIFSLLAASGFATPALAAKGPFLSLGNTDFVVLIGFLLFLGVLIYFKIPGMLSGMLDKRAADIQSELDEARALREEAQSLLASYERKQRDVQEQAERIVAHAREEAELAAEQAKEDMKASVARRLAAAESQIASAEASAVKEVRDRAATIAVGAAQEVVAKQMTAKNAGKLIDDAIAEVGAKLH
ncbi:F0F1 ATP synthase subunit B [Thalassococcus lentus]|uniref:ATP synthase subunit b n=1 Tax=Thalassococcus lentus TaxID=1210524 RepID=A0ABT4XNT0_9RHOB|nr:F0F1 ATP synthase subunit B [Thalassococcus lentus]MDA7423603.1 F0F1 ATP synthase subunit B [Thalassococcus lentus]